MVLITTTYRHDYIPPIVSRYHFFKADKGKQTPTSCNAVCECGRKISTQDGSTKPAAEKTNLKAEWTGVAPMGLLIDPRIIPSEATDGLPGDVDNTRTRKCMEEQPNRFLTILRTCYPDLYERLNKMPTNELKRRLDIERLKTTYQIDYCNLPEYPEGIYHSLEEKNAKSELNSKMLEREDGCAKYKDMEKILKSINPDDCQEIHKPTIMKISNNSSFENKKSGSDKKADNTGHYAVESEFLNKPRLTEYMESISRTGCVITRNNIHNHSKTCKTACLHKLRYPCKVIK